MTSSKNLVVLLSLISIILFSSCRSDRGDVSDNVLDIRLAKDIDRLSPYVDYRPLGREVHQYIFQQLAYLDPETYKIRPLLVKEVPVLVEKDDLFSYTIELREEARWSDGKPMTAEDVVFSLKTILHPETGAKAFRAYMSTIDSIHVPQDNDRTVEFIFDEYYMGSQETVSSIVVYPKHIYDPMDRMGGVSFFDLMDDDKLEVLMQDTSFTNFANEFNSVKYTKNIVSGSGPYQLSEWESDGYIVLDRKKNYWAKDMDELFFKAGPERMIFHIIPDEVGAVSQLKQGKIDLISNISAEAFNQLKKSKSDSLTFAAPTLTRYYQLVMNNNSPLLSDARTRKAIARLVDVDRMIETFENGDAGRTLGPISPQKPYYNEQLKPVPFDIEEAKKLLSQAGWSDSNNDGILDKKINGKREPLKIRFFASANLSAQMGILFQEEARKAGVEVDIVKKKYGLISKENIAVGDFEMVATISSQELGTDDPYQKFHSDNANGKGININSYSNPETDKIIEGIRTTRDEEKRDKLYRQFQQRVYEDQPSVLLYNPTNKIVYRSNWKGVTSKVRPGYFANAFKSLPTFATTNDN